MGKLQQSHPGGRAAPAFCTEQWGFAGRQERGSGAPLTAGHGARHGRQPTTPDRPCPPSAAALLLPKRPKHVAARGPARPPRVVAVTMDWPLTMAPTLTWVALIKRKPFGANRKVI